MTPDDASAAQPTAPKQSPPVTFVDGVDVDAVHDAVVACPGVAALGSGLPAGAATYLPGRRIPGLRVLDDAVEIELRMYLSSTTSGPGAEQIAAEVRRAAAPYVAGKRIDVVIADVVLPGESPLDEPAPSGPPAVPHEGEDR